MGASRLYRKGARIVEIRDAVKATSGWVRRYGAVAQLVRAADS